MDKEQLLINYLKKKGCSKSSIASYRYYVQHFLAWANQRHLYSEHIDYNDLLAYVSHLRDKGLMQHSIQGQMIGITHYFESLVAAKHITENPARYLEIKSKQVRKLYPILAKEQLEQLYKGFDIHSERKTKVSAQASAIRNRIVTGLMVYQGLEVTTLSKLTLEDVDVLGGTIKVQRGRTYNERTLALQAVQIIELDRYINQTRKELQNYFDQNDSELLLITGYKNYRDVHKRLIQRLKKQEPQLLSAHQIRTSVITYWLKQYNLREVQYMAGHRKIHTTESYLQNDTEGLKLDIDRFHPMNQ